MMKCISFALLAMMPTVANAISAQAITPGFDWSLLKGKWAESTNQQFGCRSDNLHQWFIVSPDKKRLHSKMTESGELVQANKSSSTLLPLFARTRTFSSFVMVLTYPAFQMKCANGK